MKRIGLLPLAMILTLSASGCGDQPIGPEGTARTDVYLRGDGTPDASSARQMDDAYMASWETGGYGAVDVKAKVWIQAESGEWVELTNQAVAGSVAAARAGGETLLMSAAVGATSYGRVRVEFDEVRGTQGSELTIGGGLAGGSIRVETGGDAKVVVEREVRFEARSGATTRLVIDLRSGQWMPRSGSGEAVAEAAFAAAVAITAE